MTEQTTITKRLIKDTIQEYLIDNGFNKKETKNIRMCLDKICEDELQAPFVFEFIEEIFCHNLGWKINIYLILMNFLNIFMTKM